MNSLITVFLQICFLRAGPQALPASGLLMWVTLAFHWCVGMTLALFSYPVGQAAAVALVSTLLVLALVQGALVLRGVPTRLQQTATALAGSEALLGLFVLPVSVWYAGGGNELAASVISLTLLAWNVAVAAHIFRHALGGPLALGVASALAYTMISYFVAGVLTGGSGA